MLEVGSPRVAVGENAYFLFISSKSVIFSSCKPHTNMSVLSSLIGQLATSWIGQSMRLKIRTIRFTFRLF